ncbi:hypothetical protein [Sphaerimonospora mesophila]|uniref:hypothetical protein n=1 Tax=Sphaerimonospora mesophila TaxID=37483 RepID=UPI0006E30161
MPRSFVEYKARGFWVTDAYLRIWLFLLCSEIDALRDAQGWLAEARQDWSLTATKDWYRAWIDPELDLYVGDDPARMAELLRLVDRAKAQALSYGEHIPGDVLEACGFTEEVYPIDTELIAICGDAFTLVLKGEITWDAATAPTLPAEGGEVLR